MRDPLKFVRLWYFLGAVLLAAVAALSLFPVPAPEIEFGDKAAHGITYLVLGGWFSLLARRRLGLAWIFVLLLAFGAVIELLQGLTSYRYGDWADLFANGLGTLFGLLVYATPLPRVLQRIDAGLARIFHRSG